MQMRKRVDIHLVGMLGFLLLSSGCGYRDRAPKPVADNVSVPAPSPAPTLTLSAQPGSISPGDSATLSWTSKDATDLSLSPNVGKVQAEGSTSVTLQNSTTFTLTATGPGGSQTAIARVTVVPAPTPTTTLKPSIGETDTSDNLSVQDAYFDLDKADIRPDAEQSLGADAAFLKDRPSIKFTLEGQCDERGSEEYNLGLGERRATAAKDFLVNAGVSADRISTISYGKDRPVCTDQTEECWQKNRRAHFQPGQESK